MINFFFIFCCFSFLLFLCIVVAPPTLASAITITVKAITIQKEKYKKAKNYFKDKPYITIAILKNLRKKINVKALKDFLFVSNQVTEYFFC